jgi:tetratricopeptide (TPR) repeat protein
VLIVFLLFNLKEQLVWENDVTLWGTTIKRSPGYVTPHLNYGYSLLDNGNLDEAKEQFLIALDPEIKGRDIERVNAASNLGNLYIREQKFELAETYFRKALELDKKYEATYYYHLGLINYIKGNLEYPHNKVSAENFYNKAEYYLLKSRIAPRYGRFHLLMAEVYLKLGKINKAKRHANTALKRFQGILSDDMIERAKQISEMTAVR